MGAKIQAFDIFQTPLSSHYPLPLNAVLKEYIYVQGASGIDARYLNQK